QPGTQTIRVKIAGESFYLSEHQGKVSFNLHGDEIYDEGIDDDNDDDDIRFRLHDQHKGDITIDYTTFIVPDVTIDRSSMAVEYLQAALNLNQEAYDFARINFDVEANQPAHFDFWVDVFVGEDRHWIAGSPFYGNHDLEVGRKSLSIDIDGRDLSTIGHDEQVTFGLSGWVQISNQLEYDYPEDYNDHDGENGSTEPTVGIPIGNYLIAIFSLSSIVFFLTLLYCFYQKKKEILLD
ncbi:MAG: hypothetical protein ACW99Q_06085, partial [Candidatus Kariarchaeaceae archaeon]